MPMTFTRRDDDGVAGLEILGVTALYLNAHPALDHEEPLRTGVRVPVRSCTSGECHAVHAHRNAGVVMGQALDCCPTEESCRIDGADGRVT